MREIICPECKQEIALPENGKTAVECVKCFEIFDASDALLANAPSRTAEISGLTLTYQKNGRTIEVPSVSKITLGRKNHGSEVLKEIIFNANPVISRNHCSIEFNDGKFYLRDENSMNGTFYGLKKNDCRLSAQIIEDKSAVWFGEELFEAQIRYRQSDDEPTILSSAVKQDNRVIKGYRCSENTCSNFESATLHEYCPNCGTKNSLSEIYD